MKKVIKGVGILVLFAFLGAGNPVVAKTTDSTTSRTMNTSHEDRDDTGKWGLLGLLGFLGLLGLRKKMRLVYTEQMSIDDLGVFSF